MLHTTLEHENWNPPRKSVWEDPEVVSETGQWSNYRETVEKGRQFGRVAHAVNPYLSKTHSAWWHNIREAVLGSKSVQQALQDTQEIMRDVMAQHRR
jgi:ABC-type glycerol-3-phosphate transport system substrate-binding protein